MADQYHDWKYFSLIEPRKSGKRNYASVIIETQRVQEVGAAFFRNVARTSSFALFPAEVAMQAMGNQQTLDYAILKVTGKLTMRDRKFKRKTLEALNREIRKQAKAQKKRFMTGKEDRAKRRTEVGVDYINRLLGISFGANQSMEAILFSIVVESYTAFETLAADLWYTALDVGPEDWRKRTALKSHRFKGTDPESTENIDLTKVADPQKAYGSFLRDTGKVSFQKLAYIKDWYRTTFGKQTQQTLFSTDRYIDALSATRNVITHKAGVTDKKFLDAVKPFPELRKFVEGKPIRLDGEIVRKLRDAAVFVGNELLIFVDEQLRHRKT